MRHSNDHSKGYGIRSFIAIFRRGKGDTEKLSDEAKVAFLKQRSDHMLLLVRTFRWLLVNLKKKNANIFPWPVRLCLIRPLLFLPSLISCQSLPRWKHSSCLVSPLFLRLHHQAFSYLMTVAQILPSDWNNLPH